MRALEIAAETITAIMVVVLLTMPITVPLAAWLLERNP